MRILTHSLQYSRSPHYKFHHLSANLTPMNSLAPFSIHSSVKIMVQPISMILIIIFSMIISPSFGALEVGFYSNTCPRAESIVSSVVRQASLSDPSIPAVLLRLHYHDCIVQGCDGSVLIQKPEEEGPENRSPHHLGLRGFDVIDQAKAQLEAECQGIVSCADIVALAARDAISLSQGPFYQVPTGRRDGLVSNIADAENMPDLPDSMDVIKAKFAEKGLSEKDLVLLSAAHTIGTTACFFLQKRLYNFLPGGRPDPLINPRFLPELESKCPKDGDVNVRIALDHGSERKFDIKILKNIRTGFGVLQTDANLYVDPSTRPIVDSYFGFHGAGSEPGLGARPDFGSDFVESMVRMGMIGVKMGEEGEIRRVCSEFN